MIHFVYVANPGVNFHPGHGPSVKRPHRRGFDRQQGTNTHTPTHTHTAGDEASAEELYGHAHMLRSDHFSITAV